MAAVFQSALWTFYYKLLIKGLQSKLHNVNSIVNRFCFIGVEMRAVISVWPQPERSGCLFSSSLWTSDTRRSLDRRSHRHSRYTWCPAEICSKITQHVDNYFTYLNYSSSLSYFKTVAHIQLAWDLLFSLQVWQEFSCFTLLMQPGGNP